MSLDFSEQPLVIGVLHLSPLPGSPGWRGEMDGVVAAAVADARAYAEGGCDAIFVENFGDMPFTSGTVASETVAAMAAVGARVREEAGLAIGFNVLRNDAGSALALCAACGGEFIRVNVHSGAMVTDQGLIQGQAYETVRRRERLCPGVSILADVLVKHAVPLAPVGIGAAARDTLTRGCADALVVSGAATGGEVDDADLREVREACPEATVLVGSGASEGNARRFLEHADGFIVASSLKKEAVITNPVDVERVRRFVGVVKGG